MSGRCTARSSTTCPDLLASGEVGAASERREDRRRAAARRPSAPPRPTTRVADVVAGALAGSARAAHEQDGDEHDDDGDRRDVGRRRGGPDRTGTPTARSTRRAGRGAARAAANRIEKTMIARRATGPSRFALPMMPWMRPPSNRLLRDQYTIGSSAGSVGITKSGQDRRADEDRHPQFEDERQSQNPLQRRRDRAHELAPGQDAADEQSLQRRDHEEEQGQSGRLAPCDQMIESAAHATYAIVNQGSRRHWTGGRTTNHSHEREHPAGDRHDRGRKLAEGVDPGGSGQRREQHEDAPAAQHQVARLLADRGGRGRRRRVLGVDGHREIRVPPGPRSPSLRRRAATLRWGHDRADLEHAPRLRLGQLDAARRSRRPRAHRGGRRPRSGSAITPAARPIVPDGRTLGAWLADVGVDAGAPLRLPYLLKLLAAASPLSIQAHPSQSRGDRGLSHGRRRRACRATLAERTYRDDNHKPELIVAMSDTFTVLAGLREIDATRRLVAELGPAGAGLAAFTWTGRMPQRRSATPSHGCSLGAPGRTSTRSSQRRCRAERASSPPS